MPQPFKLVNLLVLTLFLISLGCSKDENDKTLVNHTITLQPDATDGKDAFIYTANPDTNLGTYPDFMVYGGGPNITRSLIRFDFSAVPSNATIESVRLSLFSHTSPANGTHNLIYTQSVLQKLNSTWSEDIVTWNTQPTSSEENQVVLDEPTATIQDYLDIDITALASGMIQNPSTNHGFVFKIVDETVIGGRMVFASSDHTNAALHPKVEILYSVFE